MRLAAILAGFLLATGGAAAGDAPMAPPAAGLDTPVHASWTRLPLRQWTERASSLAGRPVVLDRRLDPEILVTLAATGTPLRQVIDEVAALAGAVADELAGSVRLVPEAAAGRAGRAERDRGRRVAALPPEPRAKLTARQAWRWPAGARPRDLVANAAADAGLALVGLEEIPHDHFPAADLPPLSLAERLDLVLAHFDRRVLWEATPEGARGRIVAIDVDIAPTATRDRVPRRDREPTRRSVTVRDAFTLRLEAPLDQALAAICGRLGLELDLDVASLTARGIDPGEIVRATVEQASRDELLAAVLQPVGLAWKIEGDRLRVFAPSP
ncbi:MAG: hypothetical protein ACKOCX_02875 [Planctomycetota bacterium]